MVMRLHKKGISPLIATILLISLAISIGATLMNLGGIYYEKFREEKLSCSKALIGAFELEKEEQCKGYEFESILNFYKSDDSIKSPECYREIGSGKGSLCITSEKIFERSWTPAKNLVR